MERIRLLVTGAGRGIGRAIALRFAAEGAPVAEIALLARTSTELEAVAAEVEGAGGRALALPADVSDAASVERAVSQALQFTGGVLDVVVNNAGIFAIHPFDETEPELWNRMLAVNLTGPFLVTRAALPGLRASKRAHLFNISSVAGRQPFEGSSAYCTTKYGLRGLTDVLRAELSTDGIRVSSLYPGATDTTIFDAVEGDWDRSSMNTPEEVAEVLWNAYNAAPDADVDDLDIPNPRLSD